MIVFPNAKINIGLHVLERRSDGYHNIETLFYPVPWCDILEVVPKQDQKITLTLSGLPVPGDKEDNFIVRCYNDLIKDFALPGLAIHLHKNIPIGGGLGGGSSNVAFFMKTLNTQFDLGMSKEEMAARVVVYGSDCPFFIYNKPMLGSGIGDKLKEIAVNIRGRYVQLVNPNIHVSTAEAYANLVPESKRKSLSEVLERKLNNWQALLQNDFEKTVFSLHPELKKIKEVLYRSGAVYAAMSGSGATCYGIFKKKPSKLNFPEHFQTKLVAL